MHRYSQCDKQTDRQTVVKTEPRQQMAERQFRATRQ